MARRKRWQRDLYGRDSSYGERGPRPWWANLAAVFRDVTRDVAENALDRATKASWDAKGGPWVARWRDGWAGTFLGLGGMHAKHFPTPEAAVEFFQQELGRRYERSNRLRRSCMVEFRETGSIIEPFDEEVERNMAVTKRDVARLYGYSPDPPGSDRRRWHRSPSGRGSETRSTPR